MKTSISSELKQKILTDIKMIELHINHTQTYNFQGVVFFNKNETRLYKECVEWFEIIKTYYITSYNGCRIKKIGSMEGIRPHEVLDDRVIFTINEVIETSWKDWFIQEDETSLKFI